MGLKFLYYIDTSTNWILFTIAIIILPFGIGGMLLSTPIKQKNVFPPWYHGAGIWVGIAYLCIALMMPFARFHHTFMRVSIALTFLVMIIAAIGLGMEIDEFSNWFENPTVKTFGSDILPTENDIYVSVNAKAVIKSFEDFEHFHKARVILVLGGTLIGLCMLLFRIVTLELVIFDEFITLGYDALTPEEEILNQALEDKRLASSGDDKKSVDSLYNQILYAGIKTGTKISDLSVLKEDEDEDEDESYSERIKGIYNATEAFGDKTALIFAQKVLKRKIEKSKKVSIPTYTDENGNLLRKLTETIEKETKFGIDQREENVLKTESDEKSILISKEKISEEQQDSTGKEKIEPTENTPLLEH